MSPWLSRNRIFEIVMSGNSSRRMLRTSPIERCDWRCGSASRSRVLLDAADDECQDEPSDLELVEMPERSGLDTFVVHVRAVQRARVAHLVALAVVADHGVAARDGDVVEEDVRVGMATHRRGVAVEREATACI